MSRARRSSPALPADLSGPQPVAPAAESGRLRPPRRRDRQPAPRRPPPGVGATERAAAIGAGRHRNRQSYEEPGRSCLVAVALPRYILAFSRYGFPFLNARLTAVATGRKPIS